MPPNAKTRKIKNFFKTPKGILTILLVIFVVIAGRREGAGAVKGLVSATLAAGLVDLLILRVMKRAWEFPSGAVLTAIIVAMVLRAQEPWYVVTITSVAAILSKYLFRSRTANVFNPAALAIIASFYVFHTGQSWWGALTEMGPIGTIVLVAAGGFIADRVNKLPLVLTFLGTYFLLFTTTAFVSDARWVAEIFRTPDLEAALYFAFVILTDPPTSPAKYPDQIVFGVIVAVVSYAFFEWAGVVYYLLAGVLVGNVWEAWRRANRRTDYIFPARDRGILAGDQSVERAGPPLGMTTQSGRLSRLNDSSAYSGRWFTSSRGIHEGAGLRLNLAESVVSAAHRRLGEARNCLTWRSATQSACAT